MPFWDYIRALIGSDTPPEPTPAAQNLQNAVDAGQQAKFAEHYLEAIQAFDYAADLAQELGDYTGLLVIALHKAEALTGLREWEAAEDMLRQSQRAAQEHGRETQMVYLLAGLGTLFQEQGDWEQARHYYEQALDFARMIHAPGAEGRSLGHLGDVYLHEGNATYAARLLRESLAKLNIAGDTELSSLFVGRLGQAMIAAGQEVEGDQLLIRALRLAKQLGYKKYQRYWGMILGERACVTGRYEDAYRAFQETLSVFPPETVTPAHGRALIAAAQTCLQTGKRDEALQHARKAVTLSDTLADSRLQTVAQGVLGMALQANHQAQTAIPHLEQAARAWHAQVSDAPSEYSEILRTLAAAYAGLDDEAAANQYRQAIQVAKTHELPLAEAQARRDFGLFYAERCRFAEAITEWSAALAIYDNGSQTPQVARLLCDIAHARKRLGQGARALKDYEQALITLNMLNGDLETRGLVLSNAANAYVEQGDIESAEAFFNEALAIARRLNDPAAESTRRGNYGWFLLLTGRSQQALSILEYAQRKSESLNLILQAAIQTSNIGVAYDVLGQYTRALEYHRQALANIQPLRNAYWFHVLKANYAHTLLAVGERQAAAALFAEVTTHGRAYQDAELMIQGLTGQAQVALAEQPFPQVEAWLNEAIALARRSDSRRLLAEALRIQSMYHAAVHHPEQAHAGWEEARRLFSILHHPQAKIRPAWLESRA